MASSPHRRIVRLSLAGESTDDLAGAISRLVAEAGEFDRTDRVQALLSAFVTEALRPHWTAGVGAREAHRRLQAEDSELAKAVESVAPILLSWRESREQGEAAVEWAESLLRP